MLAEQMTEARGIVPTTPITLTLTAAEAMFVTDALNERAVRAWTNVAKCAPGSEEREMCETAARILDGVHRRLDGALYPVCRWPYEADCIAPVAGVDKSGAPYCSTHLAMQRGIEAQAESVGLPW
jgi:hypothetical protein